MKQINGITFEDVDGHTLSVRLKRGAGAYDYDLVIQDSRGQCFVVGGAPSDIKNLAAAINFVLERKQS